MEPVAIVGISCRFPKGETNEQFWQTLVGGIDAITEVPTSRWHGMDFQNDDRSANGKTVTQFGGFLERIDLFDAAFFGIDKEEAIPMDPQQRLFLEVSWEALENACIVPSSLAKSKTGVFFGIGNNDYQRIIYKDFNRICRFLGSSTYHSIAANRLSYLLDLNGPSLALDSACSSSLTAVHLAAQSLRSGESTLALAGGVHLNVTPHEFVGLSKGGLLCHNGHCKTFDDSADGYGRGEGCGVVALKLLSQAEKNNDRILGIVKGSAINTNGASNGLTAPNGPAQQACITAALENAKLSPLDISYVEAHGTGTSLGDPIEMRSLKNTLTKGRSQDKPLYVGSAKTNIGHSETASGMAALAKVIFSLQHQTIAPHRNLTTLNKYIRLNNVPITIPTQAIAWPKQDEPRRAGVSAFGFGGANCHLIIEEALHSIEKQSGGFTVDRDAHVFSLSGHTEKALLDNIIHITDYIEQHAQTDIADLCYSLNTGRELFEHRAVLSVSSMHELQKELKHFIAGKPSQVKQHHIVSKVTPKLAVRFNHTDSISYSIACHLINTLPQLTLFLQSHRESINNYFDFDLLDNLKNSHQSAQAILSEESEFVLNIVVQLALLDAYKEWFSKGIYTIKAQGAFKAVALFCTSQLSLDNALQLALLLRFKRTDSPLASIDPYISMIKQTASLELDGAPAWQSNDTSTISSSERSVPWRDWLLLDTDEPINEHTENPLTTTLLDGINESPWQAISHSIQSLLGYGVNIDWGKVDKGFSRSKLALPSYAFQRERVWFDESPSRSNEFYTQSPYGTPLDKPSPHNNVSINTSAETKIENRTHQNNTHHSNEHNFFNGVSNVKPRSSLSRICDNSSVICQYGATTEISSNSTEKTDTLIQWLRTYGNTRINSRLIDERRTITPHNLLDLGNEGILGLQVPEHYGGLGLSNTDTMRVLQQAAAIDTAVATFIGVNNVLGIRPIIEYGTTALKSELLPLLANGRKLAAFAYTEPGAGSDFRAINTKATMARAGGSIVNGTKILSGIAGWAGVTNIFAQQFDHKEKSRGISGFAVLEGSAGLWQGPEAMTTGMKGMIQNSVHLTDVHVPEKYLLGEWGNGMIPAEDAMMYGRVALAAISVGGMKRCAQLMLRYAKRRNIQTGRLLDNPVTLARMSRLLAATHSVETLVNTVTTLQDQGYLVPPELITVCKLSGPELFGEAVDDLVQLTAGRGYLEPNIAPQLMRDARIMRIFEGPTETLRMYLGSRLVKRSEEFHHFLSADLGAHTMSQRLQQAVNDIVKRHHADTSPFGSNQLTATRWAHYNIGKVATFGILHAIVEAQYNTEKSNNTHSKNHQLTGSQWQQALDWSAQMFEESLRNALMISPAEKVLVSSSSVIDQIKQYEHTIGDIEQTAADEELDLDQLLRKKMGATGAELKNTHHLDRQDNQQSIEKISLQLSDTLEQVNVPTQQENSPPVETIQAAKTTAQIEHWIKTWLAAKISLSVEAIDAQKAFTHFGLDSTDAVELSIDLSEYLKIQLDATIIWNYPNIADLVPHLVEELNDMITDNKASAQQPINNSQRQHLSASGTTNIDALSTQELAQLLTNELSDD